MARRSPVVTLSSSAACIRRADDRPSKGAKKRLKPHQKYKGQKGELQPILQASNKWNYNFFKSVDEMPSELRKLEVYTPYYNARLMYNPNDPAEIKNFLAKQRSAKIRQTNQVLKENNGVMPKEWKPDGRLQGVNDLIGEEEDYDADHEEEFGEDEATVEYRQWKGAKGREAEREAARKERKAVIIDPLKKYAEEYEAASDAGKIKKLTEARDITKQGFELIKEMQKKVFAMPAEEVMVTLRRDHGFTNHDEELMLRREELGMKMTDQERDEIRKLLRVGAENEVKGELNGLEYYLSLKAPRLVGFKDRMYSTAPPTIPKKDEKGKPAAIAGNKDDKNKPTGKDDKSKPAAKDAGKDTKGGDNKGENKGENKGDNKGGDKGGKPAAAPAKGGDAKGKK